MYVSVLLFQYHTVELNAGRPIKSTYGISIYVIFYIYISMYLILYLLLLFDISYHKDIIKYIGEAMALKMDKKGEVAEG